MPIDIANLPADVVCELFMQAASTDPPCHLNINYDRPKRTKKRHTLGWIYLTHVCHAWRLVGLDLAPLWAALVTFFPSPSIADELLSRTRDCDLRLELCSLDTLDIPEMEAWVSQHLDRASHLIVTIPEEANQDVFRNKRLSRLRTLIIRNGRHSLGIEIDAPVLRHIHLSDSTVSFRSTMPQLTVLEISNVYYTSAEMLNTLRCVPFLERLRIFHGTGRWSGAFPHTVIELHHLAVFDMHAPITKAFLDLWEHLSVPPSATVKLVTNDIPDVSILLSSLHPRLGWSSYDSLSIFSTGFSLTCGEPDASDGEHVSVLEWRFASDRDLGIVALELLEQLQLHLVVANIHHCELELPFVLKGLDRASAEPIALRLDVALLALGVALKNTTTLALAGFEPDPALLRALAPRNSSTPFPQLRSLLLGKHQFSRGARTWLNHEPKAIKTDWALVKATLTARKQAGAPVQCLVLAGKWCIREPETQSWTSQWAQYSAQYLERDLVTEVKDERVLQAICNTCDDGDMPSLESWPGSDGEPASDEELASEVD